MYEVNLSIDVSNITTDTELVANNPCLQNSLIVDNGDYKLEGFCYNYALRNSELGGCSRALDYIIENYKTISLSKAREGDIIVFYENQRASPGHFARIYKTNGTLKGTTVRSKWGRLGIYETDLYHLPNIYGNYIEIWTKKEI